VAILDLGKRIALGTPQELIASLGADQILEFEPSGTVAEEVLRALPGVRHLALRNGAYTLTVGRVEESLPALLEELARQGLEVRTLATHAATLEDVFVELTGRGLRDD
jgi:ABC-2 type transport system ATP-binding protein